MPPRKRRRAPTNPIEAANRKTDDEFIRDHLQPSPDWTSWTHPTTGKSYALSLKSPAKLSTDEMQACFDLVELTSGADYRASHDGWKPAQKIKEMRSPELRYILVKEGPGEDEAEEGRICGFTSLMPTFEEGEPVVYCYEIHLLEELTGSGMGRKMMDYLVAVAESIPLIEKVMLTCFLANKSARAFYERLGFGKDPISPGERKLRFGKVFVPDYVIMSRRVREKAQVENGVKKAKSGGK
ncbi:GNAT family acetyltransferase nat4 [Colletotrichum karsti]|uniref:N-alpha-acetyltransferase 40 n=1 Tax=Colletotrichum karsti TaxID=1095194 RepID=A0A9P6I4N3_9PEZI|nr:GNAT family acetyltransferase nat4 [Colletotrichum karsti]KAF9876867.1 GNAT family acetyltransferase nat4 [Colletotrichum karsti]